MSDLKAFGDAALVDGVDVVDPDRHPGALVGGLVAVGAERPLVGAAAAAALAVAAQEDLAAGRLDHPNPGASSEGSAFHSNPLRQPSFSNHAKLS